MSSTPGNQQLSSAQDEPIEEACLRFEGAWKAEQQPRIEDYLLPAPEPERAALFRELLGLELAYRSCKGDTLDPGEYQQRFPEHCELILTVFREGIPPVPRSRLGRYLITAKLGSGGFGVVYKGYDEQLRREVAIKVPSAGLVSSGEDAEAFTAEARILASLDHIGIMPIYDVGQTEDGRYYLVSKFVAGKDLQTRLGDGRLSHREAVELVAQVAEALHYAHRHGLVHRDVKPANILLDAAGLPIVADFGLALRHEDFGTGPGFAGTPAYMSPEQARGEGHRVDARTDVYSLGVVFYELLTGERPFRDKNRLELLEQIKTQEPRPPRQLDDRIPTELDRICLKALSKRATDRYSTAIDLAEDLRHWQAAEPENAAVNVQVKIPPVPASFSTRPDVSGADARQLQFVTKGWTLSDTPTSESGKRPTRVVPKGLRSFDAEDADFFLGLLPGPRDRNGLPESIRFWKTGIETNDQDRTFSVGLLYGPSGCGKSSLVKAGLLPRLADHVVTVYTEATAAETESRLLNGLRNRFSALPEDVRLVDAITSLRRSRFSSSQRISGPGTKLLLVIDQFEQWLHGRHDEPNAELVEALRQCDGQRVQCLILVRDDFAMAVTRFMHDLEIPILEGRNFATVDLFERNHARKVLAEFGRAFGQLPDHGSLLSPQQEEFLVRAISGIAQESKVISVRLALLAQMLKDKPWRSSTLKEVGGSEGLGVMFLDHTFSARTANPEHLLHGKAIQRVLKAMLPEQGTELKGHMCSRTELLAASGYIDRPKEFDRLLHMLDAELRLVIPTDPEGFQAEDRSRKSASPREQFYQLTHDYLVPSLKQWLTRKQRETRRGRAELRLGERTALWIARRENRNLPAWWEWISILVLIPKRRWAPPQHLMMRRATRHHAFWTCALLALLVLPALEAFRFVNSLIARRQDFQKADFLIGKLLDADIIQVPKIIAEIEPYRQWADPRLKTILENSASPTEKLHARLALFSTDRSRTADLAKPLADVLLDQSRPESERDVVASILANYAADQGNLLAQLVVEAQPRQGGILLTCLRAYPDTVIPFMNQVLEMKGGPEMAEVDLAKRQTNAAVALLQLGKEETVWPLFRHHPESPELRTHLIHGLGPLKTDPQVIVRRLDNESDPTAQSALILCLGEFAEDSLPSQEREKLAEKLRRMYRDRPDPGLHSAVEWLLRHWGQSSELTTMLRDLSFKQAQGDRRWYINGQGQTMAMIAGPVTFWMGSPDDETDRTRDFETLHVERIPRSFDVATKEVTVREFRRFLEAHPKIADRLPPLGPDEDGPVRKVTWFQAVQYCRWLSEQEGVVPDEMCYPSVQDIQLRFDKYEQLLLPVDYLRRTGYRLPTEAEWEYACRVGARTTWFFGSSEEMLPKYAWYLSNSKSRIKPVGLLKPNDFGLFDTYGNATEWTHSWGSSYSNGTKEQPRVDNGEDLELYRLQGAMLTKGPPDCLSVLPYFYLLPLREWRVHRGGAFLHPAAYSRSATRFLTPPDRLETFVGFRVARTHR